jgi:hypothetical protein
MVNKTYFMKIHLIRSFRHIAAVAILGCSLAACDKDTIIDNNNSDPTYSTNAQASGSQTTPPTTTSASATLVGEYNARTNNWEYRVNWSGLASTATAVQIHGPADFGTAGEMQAALVISSPGVTGRAEGNITLTEVQEAYLLANRLYFTVINATNINGEVRGQIMANRVH